MAKKSRQNARPARQDAPQATATTPGGPSSTASDKFAERRENRSRGRQAAAQARRRQKRIQSIVLAVVAVLAIGLGSVFAYQRITYEDPGETVEIIGSTHVEAGTTVTHYNTNPPTSGNHYGTTARWGIHEEPVPNELQVHNLEHGGIVIQYNDSVTEEEITQLEGIASQCDVKLILAPRPDMDQRIAVTAWGHYLNLEEVDRDAIQEFIDAHVDEGPERIASESDRWDDCN